MDVFTNEPIDYSTLAAPDHVKALMDGYKSLLSKNWNEGKYSEAPSVVVATSLNQTIDKESKLPSSRGSEAWTNVLVAADIYETTVDYCTSVLKQLEDSMEPRAESDRQAYALVLEGLEDLTEEESNANKSKLEEAQLQAELALFGLMDKAEASKNQYDSAVDTWKSEVGLVEDDQWHLEYIPFGIPLDLRVEPTREVVSRGLAAYSESADPRTREETTVSYLVQTLKDLETGYNRSKVTQSTVDW
ncbi:uncharacterized protein L201_004782 [Kwoniella dendrophila CBS 6074]|uniref:Uncharacterized protein n=1 Tax=Kwoniella dendrophila CBS 6074 TaxID=1295534 RepID=A0AAX4JY81_9TREE